MLSKKTKKFNYIQVKNVIKLKLIENILINLFLKIDT